MRSIKAINEAALLKLCWELFSSSCQWDKMLTDRILKCNVPNRHHIRPSILAGLKQFTNTAMYNSCGQLGVGSEINF